MGQGGGVGGSAAGGFASFIPLILMFVIFYFLLIRPQQKKNKEHRDMINNLKRGDRIITSGGIHGTVTAVSDTALTVEISDKVRVKLSRNSVSGVVQTGATTPPQPKKKADEKEIKPENSDPS
jgi:preprotein translocase subunit YajC